MNTFAPRECILTLFMWGDYSSVLKVIYERVQDGYACLISNLGALVNPLPTGSSGTDLIFDGLH